MSWKDFAGRKWRSRSHPQSSSASAANLLIGADEIGLRHMDEPGGPPPNPTKTDAAVGEPFIVCQNLVKIYKVDELEVFALQGLDLEIRRGELMAIIGSSGSGKSTLLNVLGGLDTPTAGRAFVAGWDLLRMSNRARVLFKRHTVGFVWQNVSRNLVPYLSALENVELPMILAGKFNRNRAKELLTAVGLEERMRHKPVHMSGGEQQRVAIAIGLANNPSVLLADEPTGSLDSRTAQTVLQAFREVRDIFGVTVVVVTHDRGMSDAVDRFVEIRDGKTSTEAVRRDLAEGLTGSTHDQYTLLDSAGRLQLPLSYVERLGLQGPSRVRLTVDDQRIVIEPPEANAPPPVTEEPA
ncbi:MAG: ABC transporter ATP-binding protein [Limnochordia bacterium]